MYRHFFINYKSYPETATNDITFQRTWTFFSSNWCSEFSILLFIPLNNGDKNEWSPKKGYKVKHIVICDEIIKWHSILGCSRRRNIYRGWTITFTFNIYIIFQEKKNFVFFAESHSVDKGVVTWLFIYFTWT